MTTHQLAAKLFAMPNVTCVIEGWMGMRGYEPIVKMTAYDPEGTAIIAQAPIEKEASYIQTNSPDLIRICKDHGIEVRSL